MQNWQETLKRKQGATAPPDEHFAPRTVGKAAHDKLSIRNAGIASRTQIQTTYFVMVFAAMAAETGSLVSERLSGR